MAEFKEWTKERDGLSIRVSQLECELARKSEETEGLKANMARLKDELERLDTLRNELARKRVLLEDMERVSGEREDRIVALKSELRQTRDFKVRNKLTKTML